MYTIVYIIQYTLYSIPYTVYCNASLTHRLDERVGGGVHQLHVVIPTVDTVRLPGILQGAVLFHYWLD